MLGNCEKFIEKLKKFTPLRWERLLNDIKYNPWKYTFPDDELNNLAIRIFEVISESNDRYKEVYASEAIIRIYLQNSGNSFERFCQLLERLSNEKALTGRIILNLFADCVKVKWAEPMSWLEYRKDKGKEAYHNLEEVVLDKIRSDDNISPLSIFFVWQGDYPEEIKEYVKVQLDNNDDWVIELVNAWSKYGRYYDLDLSEGYRQLRELVDIKTLKGRVEEIISSEQTSQNDKSDLELFLIRVQNGKNDLAKKKPELPGGGR